MRITFVMRKFGNVERNSHCDVLHIAPIRVARLFLDCNGDFAIKAYCISWRVRNFLCIPFYGYQDTLSIMYDVTPNRGQRFNESIHAPCLQTNLCSPGKTGRFVENIL